MGNDLNLVNLNEFSIHAPNSNAYKALIQFCNNELLKRGACVLENFIDPRGAEVLAAEARNLAPKAYHNVLTGNAYLEEADASFAESHPKRIVDTTALGAVAFDQIPLTAELRRLYGSMALLHFIADAINQGPFYRYQCPLGALNIVVMKEGNHLRWHFDLSDFVVAISLQDPLEGGQLEYVPYIRSEGDPQYDRVQKVLSGDRSEVDTLRAPPGSLILFEGRYTIHRVTEVKGSKLRLNALLGYTLSPDVTSSEYLRMIRYGRVQ